MIVSRPPAGSLIHSVDLYDVPITTLDEIGQPGSTPGAKIGTFRANVQPMSGRLFVSAKIQFPEATHMVMLPWLGSAIPQTAANPARKILPTMHFILDDGTRLDVVFAADVGRLKRVWHVTCQEKVLT